jgi:hypothetical protein
MQDMKSIRSHFPVFSSFFFGFSYVVCQDIPTALFPGSGLAFAIIHPITRRVSPISLSLNKTEEGLVEDLFVYHLSPLSYLRLFCHLHLICRSLIPLLASTPIVDARFFVPRISWHGVSRRTWGWSCIGFCSLFSSFLAYMNELYECHFHLGLAFSGFVSACCSYLYTCVSVCTYLGTCRN